MVEENFEICGTNMTQNQGFQTSDKNASPCLKKILKFEIPTRLRIKDFRHLFDKKASPWLKKILKFEVPTWSRISDIRLIRISIGFNVLVRFSDTK